MPAGSSTFFHGWPRATAFRVYAACLMVNHYHIVGETPLGNVAHGMRFLNGVYAQASNRRHRRTGHLFEARYRSLVVQRESYLKRAVRYVVLNPVRARLVTAAAAWPWTTYRATAGLETPRRNGCRSTGSNGPSVRTLASRPRDGISNTSSNPRRRGRLSTLARSPWVAERSGSGWRILARPPESDRCLPGPHAALPRPPLSAVLAEASHTRARRRLAIRRGVHGSWVQPE